MNITHLGMVYNVETEEELLRLLFALAALQKLTA